MVIPRDHGGRFLARIAAPPQAAFHPRRALAQGGRAPPSPGASAVCAINDAAAGYGCDLSRCAPGAPDTMDGIPPAVPMPDRCPFTLDELLSEAALAF